MRVWRRNTYPRVKVEFSARQCRGGGQHGRRQLPDGVLTWWQVERLGGDDAR